LGAQLAHMPNQNRLLKTATIISIAVATILIVLLLTLPQAPQQVSTTTPTGWSGASPTPVTQPEQPAPPQPRPPSFQVQGSERYRVIIISIDALRGMDVWPLAKNGSLPNFARFVKEGIYGYATPVFPAETSPNHAAMLTGAPTGVHGVMANTAYDKSPFEGGKAVPGYWGSRLMADTIWEAADRAGLRVVVSNFIHGYVPTWQNRLSDRVVMIYASKAYDSGVPEVASAAVWTKPNFTTQPPAGAEYAAVVKIGDTPVVIAVKREGGRAVAELVVDGRTVARAAEGQWTPVEMTVTYKGTVYNITFMIKPLNLTREGFKVFKGNALVYNAPVPWFKGPEELKRRYWREVATKGYIDIYFIRGSVLKDLDLVTVAEIINATVDWYWRTNLFMFRNVRFDLMTGYDVTPDPVEHAILGWFNPNEPYSDPKVAEWARRTYVGMLQRIDKYLGELMNSLGPNDVLIVLGDHGQWEIRAFVRVNVALRKAGLLVVDSAGKVDFEKSAAYYDGGYVYINPKYKSDPALYAQVVNNVVDVLLSLRDPRTGENPIAMVLARRFGPRSPLSPIYGDERSAVYLDGPASYRAGDVVLAVKPGYCAYDRTATGEDVFVIPSRFETVGCHDDLGSFMELRAAFGVYGGNAVKIRKMADVQIMMPQVGSTAAALLGVTLKNATFPPIWVVER